MLDENNVGHCDETILRRSNTFPKFIQHLSNISISMLDEMLESFTSALS